MKAECPKDSTHDRFVTVAYVSEDWVVDREGNFLEVSGSPQFCHEQVYSRPDPENIWTCYECGAEAVVRTLEREW